MKLQKALKPEEFAAAMVNVTNRFDLNFNLIYLTLIMMFGKMSPTGLTWFNLFCLTHWVSFLNIQLRLSSKLGIDLCSLNHKEANPFSLTREQRLETLDRQFQELEEHYKSVLEKVAAAWERNIAWTLRLFWAFVGTSHMWLTEACQHYLNIWN